MKITSGLALVVLASCAACTQAPSKPAAASTAPSASASVEEANAEKICQDPHIQCFDQPIPITLHLPNGKTFTQTMEPPSLLIGFDAVYLFPGQTVYVEADVERDKLVHLHAVPAITHPEKTLTISFEQMKMDNAAAPYMMAFHIKNPFDRTLKYHASVFNSPAAYNQGPKALVRTSVCPVMAKLQNFESWPYPLFQIEVADMQLMPADDKGGMTCE